MIIVSERDPITWGMSFHIHITDAEIDKAYSRMSALERLAMKHFGRDDASIEERLMGLQIYAKVLEDEKTPSVS